MGKTEDGVLDGALSVPRTRRGMPAGAPVSCRAGRLLRLGMHFAAGMATAALVFPCITAAQRRKRVGAWSRALLEILSVRLEVSGRAPEQASLPVMLVANHVSWLDVFAINAVTPARFVAKREVRRWPVIGWLSAKAGTLYVTRKLRRDAARVVALLERAMDDGEAVALFPEATSTIGSHTLPFHASLLQAAVQRGAPVVPLAIRYARPDGTLSREAAYCGDRSLWESVVLLLSDPGLRARVEFLPPLPTAGRHRRDVARAARRLIDGALGAGTAPQGGTDGTLLR